MSFLCFLPHAKEHKYNKRSHMSTCDLIAGFNYTVKSCSSCGKGYIPFLPAQCTNATWLLRQACAPKADKKNLYLDSKIIRMSSFYNLDSIMHLSILQQKHVKITLNLNDLKKVFKTRCHCLWVYFAV